jgi:hypothetical protein
MGGRNLDATGHCVFAMRVSEIVTYNEYWTNPIYLDKKPVRNGSCRMMVGDNIYFLDSKNKKWNQADSHHSNADGSINLDNLNRDTQSNKVLVSRHFYYFGKNAPFVPVDIISAIKFKNRIGHYVYKNNECSVLTDWLCKNFGALLNRVQDDPYDFEHSEKRYSGNGSKIIKA